MPNLDVILKYAPYEERDFLRRLKAGVKLQYKLLENAKECHDYLEVGRIQAVLEGMVEVISYFYDISDDEYDCFFEDVVFQIRREKEN